MHPAARLRVRGNESVSSCPVAGYGDIETIEFCPLVKATPVITDDLDEAMCVAGIARGAMTSEPGSCVRIFPVAFRDLQDEARFRKYERIAINVRHDTLDSRPESWRPARGGDIQRLSAALSTADSWSSRRDLIGSVPQFSMCEILSQHRGNGSSAAPTLAVIKPLDRPELEILERDAEQLTRWQRRADAVAATPSLFDDPALPKKALEVIPWRFRYKYRCQDAGCGGHTQTIVDWEIIAFYLRVRHSPGWRSVMRKRWVDELWEGRDSSLFVGNQHQHPQGFLVLGVFWPPARAFTPSLWSV